MAELTTDAAALAKEASAFDKIAGDLKGVIGQVESTGGDLASHWHGQASMAAQSALQRFHEAATRQIQELTEISQNISSAGIEYTRQEEEQTSALEAGMQF